MTNLVVVGTEDQITVQKKCPFCGVEVKAFPKRITNEVGWSDYNGVRTNRVAIEFESTHQCGEKAAPVEKVNHPPHIQDTLDTLESLSTPPDGVPRDEEYRLACSDMVKELSR